MSLGRNKIDELLLLLLLLLLSFACIYARSHSAENALKYNLHYKLEESGFSVAFRSLQNIIQQLIKIDSKRLRCKTYKLYSCTYIILDRTNSKSV